MCRWMGWSGQPVVVEELLFKPKHGLVDQSLHSRLGVETTNGDGFGLGWYGQGDGPGVYHSVSPAWGDANLRELAAHIEAPLFLAHVRATTGTAIQQTNCHPFRHGRWLFVHNGVIADFEVMRRELMLAVAPELFSGHQGLDRLGAAVPPRAHLRARAGPDRRARAGDRARRGGGRQARDRERRAGERRASPTASACGRSATRPSATRARCSCPPRRRPSSALYPENERLQRFRDEDRIVVSEPLADLEGVWNEIPESTVLIVQPGPDEQRPFQPHYEPARANGAPSPAAANPGRG